MYTIYSVFSSFFFISAVIKSRGNAHSPVVSENDPRNKNFSISLCIRCEREGIFLAGIKQSALRERDALQSRWLSATLTISIALRLSRRSSSSNRTGPALKHVLRSLPASSAREIARTTAIGLVRRDCSIAGIVQSRKKARAMIRPNAIAFGGPFAARNDISTQERCPE